MAAAAPYSVSVRLRDTRSKAGQEGIIAREDSLTGFIGSSAACNAGSGRNVRGRRLTSEAEATGPSGPEGFLLVRKRRPNPSEDVRRWCAGSAAAQNECEPEMPLRMERAAKTFRIWKQPKK